MIHSIVRKFQYLVIAITATLLTNVTAAASFEPIKEAECLPWYSDIWSVGGQYVVPNNDNGVKQDSYSMLARWQGDDFVNNWLSYDLGSFTGLHTNVQKGHQPEDTNGSPGVQVSCLSVGMLINTWNTPHRPVVGGGYNDMWGYAWSEPNRVHPFIENGVETELVLQANIAMPIYSPTNNAGSTAKITGQIGMYAYLRDARPDHEYLNLHPIVMMAFSHISNLDKDDNGSYPYLTKGLMAYDYSDSDTIAANTSSWPQQHGNGVWFSSGAIGSNSPYLTTRYTEGTLSQPTPPTSNRINPPMPFWRAHITPDNLRNLVNAINAVPPCPVVPDCHPDTGYSTDPSDYVLEYAGIIAEAVLMQELYDNSPSDWVLGDSQKDQVSLAVQAYGFSVYRYLP